MIVALSFSLCLSLLAGALEDLEEVRGALRGESDARLELLLRHRRAARLQQRTHFACMREMGEGSEKTRASGRVLVLLLLTTTLTVLVVSSSSSAVGSTMMCLQCC